MQYNEQLAQYGILVKNTKAYEMRQGHLQEWLSNNLQSQPQIQAIAVVKNKTRVKVDSKIMFFNSTKPLESHIDSLV